jgi:signal recognition particle subunit SRP54
MMKAMGGAGKRGPMARLGQMFGMGGGIPQPTPEQLEAFQKQMGGMGGAPGGMPPAGPPGIPAAPPPGLFGPSSSFPGLPGLGGGKLPGLGGALNPFGGKKK